MVDGINPGSIVWIGPHSPLDWPATQDLAGVEFKQADPAGGVRPLLPDGGVRWGDITPTGWDGPIRYAICPIRRHPTTRQWYATCALEFYQGKQWTGAPLDSGWQNWVDRGKGFDPMDAFPNVVPGEELGFFLVAGSLRLKDTSTSGGAIPLSVRERSVIVRVTFTPNGVALALPPEGGSGPVVIGTPPPTGGTGQTPPPASGGTDPVVLQRLADLELQVAGLISREAAHDFDVQRAEAAARAAQAQIALLKIPTKTVAKTFRVFGVTMTVPSLSLE